jgi:multiple sugar transport system substrate-binding protein
MAPRVNNPGWVQAIQDVMDLIATDRCLSGRSDQRRPGTTAFQQFLAGTGSMLMWWGDVGSCPHLGHLGGRRCGWLRHQPGLRAASTTPTGAWEETPTRRPTWPISAGASTSPTASGDEKKRKAAWSAAAHLGGKDLSLWASAYPSGFQPYRNSHFNFDEWEAAGYDRAFVEDYLGSNLDSYNHPNAAIEPRIPGIFQYYSVAEDELAKGFAGSTARLRKPRMPSPRPGRRSPTRSAAKARSRSTRPPWACSCQLLTGDAGDVSRRRFAP